MYEAPTLTKLGLRNTCPRVEMHLQKSALGLGLISPKTAIAIKKIKLCAGSMRREGNAGKSIQLQEKYHEVEAG